jgi:hypothetical protein
MDNNAEPNAVPIVVQFQEKPSEEARTVLRSLGLRWNSIRQEWQGITQPEPVQAAAKQFGGKVMVMEAPA